MFAGYLFLRFKDCFFANSTINSRTKINEFRVPSAHTDNCICKDCHLFCWQSVTKGYMYFSHSRSRLRFITAWSLLEEKVKIENYIMHMYILCFISYTYHNIKKFALLKQTKVNKDLVTDDKIWSLQGSYGCHKNSMYTCKVIDLFFRKFHESWWQYEYENQYIQITLTFITQKMYHRQ